MILKTIQEEEKSNYTTKGKFYFSSSRSRVLLKGKFLFSSHFKYFLKTLNDK